MNISVIIVRGIVAIGYCLLSVHMVNQKFIYHAMISLLFGLVVGFPVLYMRYKRIKPSYEQLPDTKSDEEAFRWTRKFIAILACLTVLIVWIVKNGKYTEGLVSSILFVIILSPLDKVIFGPTAPVPLVEPGKSVRHVTIVGIRNMGVAMCLLGLYEFLWNINEQKDAPAFLAVGVTLLFARPVLQLLIPYRAIAATPISGPLPALTSTIVTPPPTNQQEEIIEVDLYALKTAFLDLHQLEAHARGYAFQRFLHQLFEAHHIITRSAFRLTGEEIDGSFDLGAQTYLLEAKWHAKPTAQSDLLVFNGKVEGKSTWARGIFISYAGFTADGLTAFRHGKRTSIIGMDGNDLLLILDGHITLDNAIRRKAMKAVENNDFFVPLISLL